METSVQNFSTISKKPLNLSYFDVDYLCSGFILIVVLSTIPVRWSSTSNDTGEVPRIPHLKVSCFRDNRSGHIPLLYCDAMHWGCTHQVCAHKARRPPHGRVGCQFLHGKRADWPLSCYDQEIGHKNPVSTTGVNHVVGATAMAINSIANSNRALFLFSSFSCHTDPSRLC